MSIMNYSSEMDYAVLSVKKDKAGRVSNPAGWCFLTSFGASWVGYLILNGWLPIGRIQTYYDEKIKL